MLAVLPTLLLPQLVTPAKAAEDTTYLTVRYLQSEMHPHPKPLVFPVRPQGAGFQGKSTAQIKAEQEAAEAAKQAEAERARLATVPAPQPVYAAPAPAPQAPSGDIQAIIIAAANRYGANAAQLLRVASCESGFNLYAHNASGATGLFQFMSSTFTGNGGVNIYSAYEQADVAARMFSQGQSGQWVCK